MFDVGFTELMLIGIVALVVIGPERLPAVARQAGQWVAKIQRFVRGVKTDLASEMESGDLKKLIGDQRQQINELKEMVTTAKKDFQASSQTFVNDAKLTLEDMETSVKESEELASKHSATSTDSNAAAASLSSSSAAPDSVESADETGQSNNTDAERALETVDTPGVSIDKNHDAADIGRTGS